MMLENDGEALFMTFLVLVCVLKNGEFLTMGFPFSKTRESGFVWTCEIPMLTFQPL
jgi:hypothetical protein